MYLFKCFLKPKQWHETRFKALETCRPTYNAVPSNFPLECPRTAPRWQRATRQIAAKVPAPYRPSTMFAIVVLLLDRRRAPPALLAFALLPPPLLLSTHRAQRQPGDQRREWLSLSYHPPRLYDLDAVAFPRGTAAAISASHSISSSAFSSCATSRLASLERFSSVRPGRAFGLEFG